ncbi:copper resistance CopC/CopD family protein [Pseudonocardia sp. GCM10023141]|uniref:copper resistance CopC/CopD family protein n=1 Tax=Pseudonocardia sp. GCM10023141 TaxID=3252653 RepID=UPI00360DCCFD
MQPGRSGPSRLWASAARGRQLRLALPALVALLWLALPAPAASAHAYLLASTPPGGYAVATSPAAITLDFDEPVSIGTTALSLTDPAGKPSPLGPAALSLGGRRLSAPVPGQLAEGGYRVHWQATADDGDLVSGNITFAVGTGATPVAGDSAAPVDSPVVVTARWVLFVGLALALGGLVGHRLERRVGREVDHAGPTGRTAFVGLRPAVVPGAVLGLLAAAVLAADQVGLDPSRLLSTAPGRVLLVELAGFLLAAGLGVLARTARGSALWAVAAVPLLAVVAAEGFRAHPHASSLVWGTALTIVHLIAVSVWIGGLVHVLRVARHWRRQPGEIGLTRLLLYDYSRLALALVALVIVTGTLEAVLVVPTPAALIDSTYGLVLVAKLALVVAVLVLAALARRRLRRSTITPSPSEHPLGRAVRGEAAGLIGVLVVTAVLVSVAPAGPITTALAAPPPPVGPAVSAGTLAGQITVIATVSTGQLVVHMTAPGRDDLGTDNADPSTATGDGGTPAARPADYRATAVLTPPSAAPTTLTLIGCGAGCFTSPVDWRDGINQLSLDIAAPPSPAATANLTIPWPPRPDPTLLAKVLAAMRAVPSMTVHQAVTSDYTGYPGEETALPFTGPDFLTTEPYDNGGGNPVVVATGSGDTEIRLGFPQGIAIRLFAGPDFRILREEATTPNHLITSTFEYPSGHG